MWSVSLNGVDITTKVAQVQVSFTAGNVAGECTVELADRDVLSGIVVPRVPREMLISVDKGDGSAAMSFFLESIDHPQDLNARTASIWGRSATARLYLPWAQKISKQWQAATTIDVIAQELAALCGVPVTVQNDYDICAYCYTVSDQYPSEILQDLATKSGQVLWPQPDGSLVMSPRLYSYGAPDVALTDPPVRVDSITRDVPDFGNRVLVSGDAAVAGLSVQVVPLADEDACVVADGQSTVRLIAIVTGADGLPVALGTEVEWSASSGTMLAQTSLTQSVIRQGEVHQADDYQHVTLDLPADSVVGVYARKDTRRVTNLYRQRGGSVSGRAITFAAPLDYYDQAVIVDYTVKGAPITWTAGRVPGDVTVLAAVAGAQGYVTLHQSNPSACSTQVMLEASPSSPCLGDAVTILLKSVMFGGAGVGSAVFGMQGCGSLSSTRKTLKPMEITETLRTSVWGGAAEVRLSAVPVAGSTPVIYEVGTTTPNLYDTHSGQTVILNDAEILPGTQVTATYVAGGTAMVAWLPSALPSGNESIVETLLVTHAGESPDIVAQVTLTRTPVAAPSCIPLLEISNFYASHDGKTVTLLEDGGVILPVGTQVQCTYQSVWGVQPGCSATITVRVEDGSEDGGRGQIAVTARDCRSVVTDGTYNPSDPTQIPDEVVDPEEEGEGDPTDPPDLDDEEDLAVTPTGCNTGSINARTPVINAQNYTSVFGVPSVEQCPGNCTCDEICTALRNTGRLAVEGGMSWSQCMTACTHARDAACSECTLTGPTTLAPGAEGTWHDDKTNSGEWRSTHLNLKERTSFNGYKATMPLAGKGPFVVKVCYGDDERTCCETTVDFPPCSLTGPDHLAQGQEGTFVPSLGMSEATAVVRNMEPPRNGGTGFVTKLADGQCSGEIDVYYGGRLCGTKEVTDTYAETVGVVVGDSVMEAGETGLYAHNLSVDGLTYTGTLPIIPQVDGNGQPLPLGASVIGQVPEGAAPGTTYTVAFASRCGITASMTVTVGDPCLVDSATIDAQNPDSHPSIGQWVKLYGGTWPECYAQVYSIASDVVIYDAGPLAETYPSTGVYPPSCDWGAGAEYAPLDIITDIQPYGTSGNSFSVHRTRCILAGRTVGNPC